MPRVAEHVVAERRRRLTQLLEQCRYLPVAAVAQQLGVSQATARRDLAALSRQKKLQRTFGGAVSTGATIAEYDERFASFAERAKVNAAAKRRIAATAMTLIRPQMTLFIDAGTTLDQLAGLLVQAPAGRVRGVTVVTHSLAVADRLAESEAIETYLLAGRLLARQSIVLGAHTVRSARAFRIDLAFLGAEGFGGAGVFNSHAEVVRLQQAVARQAKRTAICMDAAKLGRSAPVRLLSTRGVDLLITDATRAQLAAAGVSLLPGQLRHA